MKRKPQYPNSNNQPVVRGMPFWACTAHVSTEERGLARTDARGLPWGLA
jgi:hypothetical protein